MAHDHHQPRELGGQADVTQNPFADVGHFIESEADMAYVGTWFQLGPLQAQSGHPRHSHHVAQAAAELRRQARGESAGDERRRG